MRFRAKSIAGLVIALLLISGTALATMSYKTTVTTAGPVAYYRVDESSGTTAGTVGGGFAGTYLGSPAKSQTGLVHDGDNSVKFDGVNDAISANSVANHTNWPGMTMEAWVEVTRSAPSDEEHIMNFSTSSGGHAPGLFHDNPTNKIKFAVGSSTSFALSNNGISSGTHYIVGTVGTDNVSRLYIDGVLQNQTGKITVRPQPGWLFIIGADHDFGPVTTSFWKGRIDEPAIWDHALTSTQIAAQWNAGK
jgi:Concanavalin A-like lectin/glucanases superfamily